MSFKTIFAHKMQFGIARYVYRFQYVKIRKYRLKCIGYFRNDVFHVDDSNTWFEYTTATDPMQYLRKLTSTEKAQFILGQF